MKLTCGLCHNQMLDLSLANGLYHRMLDICLQFERGSSEHNGDILITFLLAWTA